MNVRECVVCKNIDQEKINSDHLSQLIDQQYYIQEQAELIKTLKVVLIEPYRRSQCQMLVEKNIHTQKQE